MKKKIGMISLGCPKNQVDAEIMLAKLLEAGYEITAETENTDLVIVNTCGFIDDAKKEAIDAILYVADLKKQGKTKYLVVTGCLAQRYKDEVLKEIPEIDAVLGIGANEKITDYIDEVFSGESISEFPPQYCLPLGGERILTTAPYSAYLKIAEGCSNRCAYCAIPYIRGNYRSRAMKDILLEAQSLAERGVKEIIIVAQDVTKYGIDLYHKLRLADLLNEMCKIDGIKWIRLLYCYPDSLTDELIDTIAKQEKICKYIDLPLQHGDSEVLRRMNRVGSAQEYALLIERIRAKIPDAVVRTTLITGFPGETQENFETLCNFVKDVKFDRLGCFCYSPEEGTPAAVMENQIDEDVKKSRAEVIMNIQYDIFEQKQKAKIGRVYDVLVEGFDEDELLVYGRTYMDAPEIDSRVILSANRELTPGEFVKVKIIAIDDIDLVGEVLE